MNRLARPRTESSVVQGVNRLSMLIRASFSQDRVRPGSRYSWADPGTRGGLLISEFRRVINSLN